MTKENYGLTTEQAAESKKKYGTNALSVKEGDSFWKIYLGTFEDTWIRILLAAAIIDLLIYVLGIFWPQYFSGDLIEVAGVVFAMLLSTGVSALTEWKNNKQYNTLQAEASKIKTKVYRDGELHEMLIDDLVKGDVVLLQAGDQVPVDGLILKGSCEVSQAALNGESEPCKKEVAPETLDRDTIDEDYVNPYWVYRGSVITEGEVLVEARVIGDSTVLGTIADAIGEKTKPSPSAEKMDKLAGSIGKLGLYGATLAVIANIVITLMSADLSTYTIGSYLSLGIANLMLFVAIIIMAVPEGLPMMNSLVASMNCGRMIKENVLVRHAESIETTGYMNVLFSDKTGTITKGQLEVVDIIDVNGNVVPAADRINQDNVIAQELVKGLGLNNDAMEADGKAIGSNGTDRALLNFLIENDKYETLDRSLVGEKEPFTSATKCARVHTPDGIYWKGAPEAGLEVAKYCMYDDGVIKPLNNHRMEQITKAMKDQMGRAMRLLLIMKETPGFESPIFLGIVCIRDEVRPDVVHTVEQMNTAGCAVVMVTGDSADTAQAIARDAGILKHESDVVLTSKQLAAMSDDEVKEVLPFLRVVSRARPMDKRRLVQLAQDIDMVCGMTGDGVNDAAALSAADVGFAMGDGTSVAKDASDIVIVDNSLTSIGTAMKYGRTMTKSVQKFLIFQLTVNITTILMNVLAPFLGFSEPFTIVQILWINLIMDTLAALAFGEEPALDRYMDEKPVSRNASVLTHYMKSSIGTAAIYIAVISVLGYCTNWLNTYLSISTDKGIRSFVFCTFIYAVIFNAFNTRSSDYNIFEGITKNKKFLYVMGSIFVLQTLLIYVGGAVFGTVPMDAQTLLASIGLGFLIIPVDMVKKFIYKHFVSEE